VWLIECWLLTVTSGQEIVTAPANTAATVSSQAFFNCTADVPGGDALIWEYYQKDSQDSVRIYTSDGDGEGVRLEHRDKFAIDRGSYTNGVHNLVVKNVQMDLGVRYYCGFAKKGNKEAAELVAIGTLLLYNSAGTSRVKQILANYLVSLNATEF